MNSVKLEVMRWRGGHFWIFLGALALAILLVAAGHPCHPTGPSTGMSAPPAPATSAEFAPAVKLLQSQFDWHSFVPESNGHVLALLPTGTTVAASPVRVAALPHYGPLHRRPPPNLS